MILHQRDHWDRRTQRLEQTRHKVGGAWTTGRGTHARPTGDLGIGMRHDGSMLLIVNSYATDDSAVQRMKHLDRVLHAKNPGNTMRLQCLGNQATTFSAHF